MVERRQFGQRTTRIHAFVRFGNRHIACVVGDVSADGALLELAERVMLPYTFQLEMSAREVLATCELRHQSGQRVGVSFVKAVVEQRLTTLERISAAHVFGMTP